MPSFQLYPDDCLLIDSGLRFEEELFGDKSESAVITDCGEFVSADESVLCSGDIGSVGGEGVFGETPSQGLLGEFVTILGNERGLSSSRKLSSRSGNGTKISTCFRTELFLVGVDFGLLIVLGDVGTFTMGGDFSPCHKRRTITCKSSVTSSRNTRESKKGQSYAHGKQRQHDLLHARCVAFSVDFISKVGMPFIKALPILFTSSTSPSNSCRNMASSGPTFPIPE